MIASIHLLAGGALGAATNNPYTALVAGIVSHFILDAIPHNDHPEGPRDKNGDIIWTKKIYIFAYTDSIIGGLITVFFWYQFFDFSFFSPFIWGAAGGYLPDFIDNVPYWKQHIRKIRVFKLFHQFHEKIHYNWEKKWPMPKHRVLGITTQITVFILSLLLLY